MAQIYGSSGEQIKPTELYNFVGLLTSDQCVLLHRRMFTCPDNLSPLEYSLNLPMRHMFLHFMSFSTGRYQRLYYPGITRLERTRWLSVRLSSPGSPTQLLGAIMTPPSGFYYLAYPQCMVTLLPWLDLRMTEYLLLADLVTLRYFPPHLHSQISLGHPPPHLSPPCTWCCRKYCHFAPSFP